MGAKSAVIPSLVVVGITSLVAAVQHRRKGTLRFRVALSFAATGIPGAVLGGWLSRPLAPRTIQLAFAGVMVASALGMLFRRERAAAPEAPSKRGFSPAALGVGFFVGILTGVVGAGGGFLIVPALVLLAGVPMRDAVGTSLVVITFNCAAGLLGKWGSAPVDWRLTLAFTACAVGEASSGWGYWPRLGSGPEARFCRVGTGDFRLDGVRKVASVLTCDSVAVSDLREFRWLRVAHGMLLVGPACGKTVLRTGGRTMRMLLAVPVMALLGAPAMAKPDLPPGTFKAEVRMHMAADGRAERQIDHAARPSADAYATTRTDRTTTFDKMGRESHFAAPLKTQIALKIQNGDNREGNSAAPFGRRAPGRCAAEGQPPPVALRAAAQDPDRPEDPERRQPRHRQQQERVVEAGRSLRQSAHNPPLSKGQKEALCRQTGVCIPFLEGSDNTEDKTENPPRPLRASLIRHRHPIPTVVLRQIERVVRVRDHRVA